MRPHRLLPAAVVVALLLSACGGEPPQYGVTGADVEPLRLDLQGPILGLTVEQEDVSEEIAIVERTYAEALSVHSLRRDDLVQATFQATRLGPDADVHDELFRRTIVETMGSRSPRRIRVGDKTVWLTTGTEQTLAAWFHDRSFYVLAVRAEYEEPMTLLRLMLEMET